MDDEKKYTYHSNECTSKWWIYDQWIREVNYDIWNIKINKNREIFENKNKTNI